MCRWEYCCGCRRWNRHYLGRGTVYPRIPGLVSEKHTSWNWRAKEKCETTFLRKLQTVLRRQNRRPYRRQAWRKSGRKAVTPLTELGPAEASKELMTNSRRIVMVIRDKPATKRQRKKSLTKKSRGMAMRGATLWARRGKLNCVPMHL